MDFPTFKINVVEIMGLAKDALHIYVGIGVYLLGLFVLRPIIKNHNIRAFIALIIVIGIALFGEYLDNRPIITSYGLSALTATSIKASIHDLINTCLLPFVLFALNKWTKIFQAASPPSKMLKKTR